MALSNKQRVFVEEYLRCWNASEAARLAGYSEKSARVIGHENLTKPDIAAEIKLRLAERTMGADEVLVRLAEQARGDIGDFVAVAANGDVALDFASAQDKTHLIKKVTQRHSTRTTKDASIEEVVLTLELHDAQAALVHIGKHHQLFATKVEHSGSVDVNFIKGYTEVTPDDWDGNES